MAAGFKQLLLETDLDDHEAAADPHTGYTANADTDVSGNGWVLDEDDMASNSDEKVPTQQSVKAYVDAQAGGGGTGAVFIPAAAMWPSTTNGCAWPARREFTTNDVDDFFMAFGPDADEYGQFKIVLPGWDGGTVTATIYWTTVAAGGTTVCWSIQGRSSGNDEAIDTAWGNAVAATDTVLAAGDEHVITTGDITVSGAGASEEVRFRIMRDVSEDNCASNADLGGILINYTKA